MSELTLTPEDLPAWLPKLLLGVLLMVIVSWARIIQRVSQGKPIIGRRLRRRVPWGLDGALLVALVLLTVTLAPLSSLLEADQAKPAGIEIGLREVGLMAGTQLIFAGIAVGILMTNNPQLRWADFGFTTNLTRLPRDITFGVMAAAAMLPMVYMTQLSLVAIFGEPTPHPAINQIFEDPSFESLAAVAVLAVIVAPLFEEFAFRVLLQGGLESKTSRRAWWPIWVSSICFGLAHTNQGFAPVSLIMLALGMGYLYRQTHSYVAVVSMHMAFNALSISYAIGFAQALSAK